MRPDRFAAITRRKGLEAVLAAIEAALDHGFGGRCAVWFTCVT